MSTGFGSSGGDQIWRHVVKPYDDPDGMAAGDTEGIPTRTLEGIQAFCLPATGIGDDFGLGAKAHWSAAMIDGGGTVLAGRSDGNLYQAAGLSSGSTSLSRKNPSKLQVAHLLRQ